MEHARFAAKSRITATLIAIIVIGGLYATAIAHDASLVDFRFNPFVLLSASTIAVNLGLFIYLARRSARTEERIWLCVYFLSLTVYATGELLQRLSVTPSTAIFWQLLSACAGGIGPSLFLFTLAYTNQSQRHYPGLTALLVVSTTILAFFYMHSNLIFDLHIDKMHLFAWGWNNNPGPGIIFPLLWYDGLVIVSLARLISFRRHTRNPILRQQSKLFIIATIIPIALGTITDGVIPSLGINIPTFAMTYFTVAGVLFVYGVKKYQLLAINPTIFSHTVLAIIDDAVVVTDQQFDIVYVNTTAETLLGVKNESANRASLTGAITDHYRSVFEGQFTDEALKSGVKVRVDQVDIHGAQHGSTPVRATGSRLHVADHDLWVIVLTDITKELQTRSVIEHEVTVRTEELNEARAYLVSSINSLEQGFILVNRNSKVELVNGVAGRLFGSTVAESTDKHLAEITKAMAWNIDLPDVVHKVLDARHHRQIQAAAEDGSFYEVYVTPVLAGERELGATIIIQNITEQKILDRSKDEFFSIASHELRTPLTAIRGNMSMVKDYFPDAMKDESLAAMVDDTHAASIRLIEIVSDFLDSSKLEQGKMVFNLAPLAVGSVVAAVISDLGPIIKTHNNTVAVDGLDKLPKILADEGRYRQIIYNLLSNATKYSENSTITITADHDDKVATLHITDIGRGIPPEGQKLLFHKFQQAGDMLTRDDTKGTGLGLYISRLLATHMHGDVVLERTEENKGSTFAIRMPLADKK